MQSNSATSHLPARVPPQGPLRWFFAQEDSGQRKAMSGSEQSPQSLHLNITALPRCSAARIQAGPWKESFELAQSLAPALKIIVPGVNIASWTTLEKR